MDISSSANASFGSARWWPAWPKAADPGRRIRTEIAANCSAIRCPAAPTSASASSEAISISASER